MNGFTVCLCTENWNLNQGHYVVYRSIVLIVCYVSMDKFLTIHFWPYNVLWAHAKSINPKILKAMILQ